MSPSSCAGIVGGRRYLLMSKVRTWRWEQGKNLLRPAKLQDFAMDVQALAAICASRRRSAALRFLAPGGGGWTEPLRRIKTPAHETVPARRLVPKPTAIESCPSRGPIVTLVHTGEKIRASGPPCDGSLRHPEITAWYFSFSGLTFAETRFPPSAIVCARHRRY